MTKHPAFERAVKIVQQCKLINTRQIIGNWGSELIQLAYNNWAIDECLKRLNAHPEDPPLEIMEGFSSELDRYSMMSSHVSYAFSTAKDTVQWIIDMLVK